MIKDIAHICLAATDLGAAERFYCQGLGFKKAFEFIRGGACIGFYLEICKGRYIEVFLRDSIQVADGHPMLHMCFEVEDLDLLRTHLTSQRIEVTEKKRGADRSWQAWTTDPSGVRIEFHQYTSESSQVTGENCLLS